MQIYREVDAEDAPTTFFLGFDKTNTRLYWKDSTGRDLGGELVYYGINSFIIAGIVYSESIVDNRDRQILYTPTRAEAWVLMHTTQKKIMGRIGAMELLSLHERCLRIIRRQSIHSARPDIRG
jgi:hypothetical protein